jgi:hypothetical protein
MNEYFSLIDASASPTIGKNVLQVRGITVNGSVTPNRFRQRRIFFSRQTLNRKDRFLKNQRPTRKTIEIVAGLNGSGKSTFAESYFLQDKKTSPLFINSDVLATGISPLNVEAASFTAGSNDA